MTILRLLVLLLTTVCTSELAYAQAALCVSEYLNARKADRILGIAAADAEQLVSKVAQSIGLTRTVMVLPCTYIEKAHAWPGNEEVPEGEYIIYNPTWVREIIGKDEVQAVALFGHELGHFLNGDFTVRKGIPRQQQELDADQFAGCAVARMSNDLSKLENLLSRLRQENDMHYPNRLTSLDRAKAGFKACGGIEVKKCRLPQHGIEGWGAETPKSGSSNWRGGGGSQPGYCAEYQAQLRQEHPEAMEINTLSSSETTRDVCAPFRCIQYQYFCSVIVKSKPVFREMESANCP